MSRWAIVRQRGPALWLAVGLSCAAPSTATAVAEVEAPPSAASAAGLPYEVGRPFPDLALPGLDDGPPTSLARYRGKKLVLHVFASW